jgi:hypothetical protein
MPVPAQVFHDTMDIEATDVAPVPFGGDVSTLASYPLPQLALTGASRTATLGVVVLENGLVRAVVAPSLGGRLLSLADLRTGQEVLGLPKSLAPVAGGSRGLRLDAGLQFGPDRPNAMGTVDLQLREAPDDGSRAALFLHELVVGTPFSWTVCVSVEPGSPKVLVEWRLQNRSLDVAEGQFDWAFPWDGDLADVPGGLAAFDGRREAGLDVSQVGARGWGRDDRGLVRIVPARADLGPRETLTGRLELTPLTAIGRPRLVGGGLWVSWDGPKVRAVADRALEGLRIVCQGESGARFDAPLAVGPEQAFAGTLPEAVWAVAVPGVDLVELEWTDPAAPPDPWPSAGLLAWRNPAPGTAEAEFLASGRVGPAPFGFGHVAAWEAARTRITDSDHRAAAQALSRAASAQDEDALAWWAHAVATRLAGEDLAERHDLLNAHYLSPLEPLLRAEAYLSTPVAAGKEPNPVSKPLAENPDAALEAVCALLDLGLDSEAARLGDELLRHRELPLLRYLLAHSLLRGTRMVAEAAAHVRTASDSPIAPPFPWRPLERAAVTGLAERFPDDRRLATLSGLLGRVRTSA